MGCRCYHPVANPVSLTSAPVRKALLSSAELRLLADSMDAVSPAAYTATYGLVIGDHEETVMVRDGRVGVLSYFEGA